MFFAYDGSMFYMSRDGVDFVYERFDVPQDVEAQWMAELADVKLAQLVSPRNGRVIRFFTAHRDPRHLRRFLDVEPLGDVVDQCVYLENLVEYVAMCRREDAVDETGVGEACDYLLRRARELRTASPDARSDDRIARLIAEVATLRSS